MLFYIEHKTYFYKNKKGSHGTEKNLLLETN